MRIDERSYVDGAVILPHVDVGRGCTIKRSIIDEGCQIPDGLSIGTDLAQDSQRFHVTENGVVLVTADMLRRLTHPVAATRARRMEAPVRLPRGCCCGTCTSPSIATP